MSEIVPKQNIPGVDFCGVDKNYYIVRSDLGCYMSSTNFNEGKDLEVFSLHNSCRGGDHYLAHEDGHFYVIKGDHYRCVSNMNTDKEAIVYSLHPKCRGGEHYLSAFGKFFIIFQRRGIYRQVKNLNTDEDAIEHTLHPSCKDGLYYWGTKGYFYFVKPCDEWGVQYCRCTDFHQNVGTDTYSFHADVVNFLPGGLAITQGPSFGKWEVLKTISNESMSPIVWNKTITRKVGYEEHKMKTIVKNWEIRLSAIFGTGTLIGSLAKVQFSLSGKYGGKQVSTEEEEWSEATEVEESINVTLEPCEKICIWQYILGLGQEPALFCRSMTFTSDSNPPRDIPLPPSKQ
ncbi:hypothetical protein lerEdw1_015970 [Lerista edwardsae]|nr:hypothetical protein lerEdw1_015970 [Lerista edwardsae]